LWVDVVAMPGRQWMYQTCTEFGYYQTSDDDHQPFGPHFPLKWVSLPVAAVDSVKNVQLAHYELPTRCL